MRDYCAIIARLFILRYNQHRLTFLLISNMFKPKYKLTNKILSLLTETAEAKTIIEKAKILPEQELKLRRQALARMTQSSTAIEGNILNLNQVEALIVGKKVDAPERDIYEVKNYLATIKYIEKIEKEKKPLTEKIILKIHKLVTKNTLSKDKSGKYRTVPVYIVRRQFGKKNKVIYTAPPAKDAPDLMKNLIDWINISEKENIHPVIAAGIAHREFAAIHPFVDGNGRTARALATLILYQRGYDFRKLFALEDYYNLDKQRYYQEINIGQKYNKKDFTKWLEYFIEGFKEEIIRVKEEIVLLETKKIGSSLKKQIMLSKKQAQIIDFINTIGKITAKDAADILRCPKRTAQLELQKLKKQGIIKQTGKGPAAGYVVK